MRYQKLVIKLLLRAIALLYIITGNEEVFEKDVIVIDAKLFLKNG